MDFVSFMLGKTKIKINKSKTVKLLNICSELDVSYGDLLPYEDETSFLICTKDKKRLLRELAKKDIEYKIVSEVGFPILFKRYKKRAGLLVGLALGIALAVVSKSVIWKIEIKGNENIEKSEIAESLINCGLYLGKNKNGVDTDNVANRLLLSNDKISWASVSIDGTTAVVEIRETENDRKIKDDADTSFRYANVVSKFDGRIEKIEDYLGEAVVQSGDYVRKGDILISGIYKNGNGHEKFVRAGGKVFGSVIKSYSVLIPYKEEIKTPDRRKLLEKNLIFFNKSIKLYKNSRNTDGNCDIINNNYALSLFGRFELPVFVEKTEAEYYTLSYKTLTKEEMIDRAYSDIKKEIEDDFDTSTISGIDYSGEFTDEGYLLKCRVVAYSEIGEIKEIEIIK